MPRTEPNTELPINWRPSRESKRQLEELMQKWGENKSGAITRALQIVHSLEFPRKKKAPKKGAR
jgi:hypothetical protein